MSIRELNMDLRSITHGYNTLRHRARNTITDAQDAFQTSPHVKEPRQETNRNMSYEVLRTVLGVTRGQNGIRDKCQRLQKGHIEGKP
jgi:hypothetical protein